MLGGLSGYWASEQQESLILRETRTFWTKPQVSITVPDSPKCLPEG